MIEINHWGRGVSGATCHGTKDGITYFSGDAVYEPYFGLRIKIEHTQHEISHSFEGAHVADVQDFGAQSLANVKRLAKCWNEYDQLKAELHEARLKCIHLHDENGELRNSRSSISNERDKLKSERDELYNNLKTHVGYIEHLKAERDELLLTIKRLSQTFLKGKTAKEITDWLRNECNQVLDKVKEASHEG